MNITIDLRGIQSGIFSGVENYTLNLLEYLLARDKSNGYVFYYNAFHDSPLEHLQYVNVQNKKTNWPNRLLNLGFLLRIIKFSRLSGPFDCLFLPNPNLIHLGPFDRLVLTCHDLSPLVDSKFYNLKRRLWHRIVFSKRLFRSAKQIIAVSQFTKNDIVSRLGIPENKISVVYPGIRHDLFHPKVAEADLRAARNIYNLPRSFILFLSTLEPRKNLLGLINAFNSSNTEDHLVIAGRLGWEYGPLLEAMATSPKRDRIHYIGFVEEGYKPALYKLAKLVCYPSIYEGFGFVPLEAMAVGTPVISSNVTSMPEVLGDAALLVNPFDSLELSYAIAELSNNNALRENLITKGFEQAKKYTWEHCASQTLEVFQGVKL